MTEKLKAKPLTESQRRVIEAYRVLMEQKGQSLREAARPLRVAGSTLSQVLSGSYAGNVGAICSRMGKYLAREKRRKSAPGRPPFCRTSVALDVLDICRDAHALRLPVLITGASGSGRTVALKEYCRQEPATIYVAAGPYARPKALLDVMAAALEIEAGSGIHRLRGLIAQTLEDADRLVIVDEIDYVGEYTLQTLRMLADAAHCGIVYCGTRAFLEKLRRRRSATIEQFLNRLAFAHDCPPLADEDMDMLLAASPLDARCREIARMMAAGCARRLVNGMLLARRMAGEGQLTAQVVQRAFKRLLKG